MKNVIIVSIVLALGSVVCGQVAPNIILFLADDLGYGDLGFTGHPSTVTPHIDALAESGRVLTGWYSGACVCSPSRAALMTGRQFTRIGVWPDVFRCDATNGLPTNETTIAKMLKSVGYRTHAIGKWHLGQREEFLPTRFGFDSYHGVPYSVDMGAQADLPYHGGCPYLPLFENTTVVEQPIPLDDLSTGYASSAAAFIDAHTATHNSKRLHASAVKDAAAPYFLYVAFSHVHVSIPARKQYCAPAFNGTTSRGAFGDALAEMDAALGSIMGAVKRSGTADNTLVIFTSDNGPWRVELLNGGSAGLFTGLYATTKYGYWDTGKGSTWEGGMRMPSLVSWPAKIPPGSRSNGVVSSLDVLPTICSLVPGCVLPNTTLDGINVDGTWLSGISDVPASPVHTVPDASVRPLFMWRTRAPVNQSAIRWGAWKAHFITQSGFMSDPPVYHSPPLLFHVEEDPSEQFPVDTSSGVGREVATRLTLLRNEYLSTFPVGPTLTGDKDQKYYVCQKQQRSLCFHPN